MEVAIRPSRLWPKLFKYYLIGFILMVPFLYKILANYNLTTRELVSNYLSGLVSSSNISLTSMRFIHSISLPLFIFGMFLVFIAEVKRFRIKYVFYDDRVVREVGIFITDIRDVSYDHIDYFHTKRTLAQRILGTADLKFKTPGDPESMVLEGVGDPERWTEFIMKKANISVQ